MYIMILRRFVRLFVLTAVGLALVALVCNAQEKKKAPVKRAPNPAMAPIEDKPGLPRVLLIGDSISIGYTIPVREALAGKANVHRPQANCGPTIRGVEKLDEWLGKGKWDVIHFNFGLHDLKVMPEGKEQVPLPDYEKNMRELVGRLKKTGAALIWCSTTPVPETSTPVRKNDKVIAYNAVAKKIMDENQIRIDDLYSFALPQIQKIQLPNNVHFSPEGSKVLAQQVSKSILEVLPKK
jgi:acyl-CoA thioesterase-1